jgi:hypothetical protein
MICQYMWEGTYHSELEGRLWNQSSDFFIYFVDLEKLLNFSEKHFSHLLNSNGNTWHCVSFA